MTLNKTSAFVLLHLLKGAATAAVISRELPAVDVRSVQRALTRLVEMGLIARSGSSNNPTYSLNYDTVLQQAIPAKLLENEERPEVGFNFGLIDWLEGLRQARLNSLSGVASSVASANTPMTAKELEHLTIELSWKSSALEGNTYTLLDTQLLLMEGVKAKNRTEFETQMILNHKDAIAFIVANSELFTDAITFRTVEELHHIIGKNLGIDAGVRKRLVRITASNYVPLSNPHQLREQADRILAVISQAQQPFTRALLALALVPYLQIFEDGNKRTGRMLANALLIHTVSRGFSLRKTEARELALAYLAFYEFNSLQGLSKVLRAELN